MTKVEITGDLRLFVKRLGDLINETPLDAPDYSALDECYTDALDLLERTQEQAIDDADAGYLEFSKGMKEAMAIFDEAEKDIARISKAINVAAKVVKVAGKVIGKVC